MQVGNVSTKAQKSIGVLAQSIGGGGGNVGFDMNMTIPFGGAKQQPISPSRQVVKVALGTGGDVTLNSVVS